MPWDHIAYYSSKAHKLDLQTYWIYATDTNYTGL